MLNSLNINIKTLKLGEKEFVVETRRFKFYGKYTKIVLEQGSQFRRKLKEEKSWETDHWVKQNTNIIGKPFYIYNTMC